MAGVRETPTVSGGQLCGQDFEALRAACLEAGELFTDPEFPPDDQSLYFSQVRKKKQVEQNLIRNIYFLLFSFPFFLLLPDMLGMLLYLL